MTDGVDENLLTAAKVGEVAEDDGDLDGDLYDHVGLVEDDRDRSVLSFLSGLDEFDESSLSEEVAAAFGTDAVDQSLRSGDAMRLSRAVGVTETDLEGGQLSVLNRIQSDLDNNGAPAFVTIVGDPNSGKSNTAALLAELRRVDLDRPMVLSNVRSWSGTDRPVTGAHDLAVDLIGVRDRPKIVVLDEASTHFDARTYRHDVATQWTPLAKRFAKIGVDMVVLIGHTGKDIHPEAKRLTTMAIEKLDRREMMVYQDWPADSDEPADPVWSDPVTDLQSAASEPDPDDAAPWSWDLAPELFSLDLSWEELHQELIDRGPVD